MTSSGTNVLEMREITKEFPGVKALSQVSFSVRRGEIHALCGENGAGKSTLMKTLSGFYPFSTYSGEILVEGQKQEFHTVRDSERAGLAIIYQELSLIPEMTVGENIFLGREPRTLGVINWNEVYSRSQELLQSIGLNINPRTQVKYLGIGQQQLVEIAKALSQSPKILIMDEPTSALTESEVEILLNLMRQLRSKGVSCILISHKLNEVFAVADRITVLRDGRSIATHVAKDINEARIIADMVGRELKDLFPRLDRTLGEPVLEVKGMTVDHPSLPGKKVLQEVSFSVRRGEILGIAGLMGAGRTELLLSLFGAFSGKVRGSVRLNGKELSIQSPHDAIEAGLNLVTEDRKRLGLVLEDTVMKNMTLAALPHLFRRGLVNRAQEVSIGQKYVKDLRVKTPSLNSLVKNLSGGNQQKVVIAKCLLTEPKVLFLDEPTRGIDVGARAEIYGLMNELAAQGMAIVMVSSELPEILGMSDRVLVMNSGRLVQEFKTSEATQEKIMAAATAVH